MKSAQILLIAFVGVLAVCAKQAIPNHVKAVQGLQVLPTLLPKLGGNVDVFATRDTVQTGCLKSKEIKQCDDCSVIGLWENVTNQEMENFQNISGATITINLHYTMDLTEGNVATEFINVTMSANTVLMDLFYAYMSVTCPDVPRPSSTLINMNAKRSAPYSSTTQCLLELGGPSCEYQCEAETLAFTVDPCQSESPGNFTDGMCDTEMVGAKLSMSNECETMIMHDMDATDESSDVIFHRKSFPAPVSTPSSSVPENDFLLIGIGLVVVVLIVVVGFFLYKKFGKKNVEHEGDDGLYEMGRDFDDDF